MIITREMAEKVRDTIDAGLVQGLGKPIPGQMCVQAAVCFALGLPHGDDPPCVAPSVRSLLIRLTDSDQWSSPLARAQGLRRLGVAQLGSAGVLDEREFSRRVAEMTIRRVVPIALRAAAGRVPHHAAALEAAAVRCEHEGTSAAARTAAHAADVATAMIAAQVATHAACEAERAAWDAAAYADDVADAVAHAAVAAAATAGAVSCIATADPSAADRILGDFAEWVVAILMEMGAPGCQWLDLVPLEREA